MAEYGRHKLRKDGGFTLLELLVVVTIVGIIAATAIPRFGGYRMRAFKTELDTDAKNAYTAAIAYLSEGNNTTVDSMASLKAGGYRNSGNIQLSGGPMTTSSGSLELYSTVLKSYGKDNNAVIFWNGKIDFSNRP